MIDAGSIVIYPNKGRSWAAADSPSQDDKLRSILIVSSSGVSFVPVCVCRIPNSPTCDTTPRIPSGNLRAPPNLTCGAHPFCGGKRVATRDIRFLFIFSFFSRRHKNKSNGWHTNGVTGRRYPTAKVGDDEIYGRDHLGPFRVFFVGCNYLYKNNKEGTPTATAAATFGASKNNLHCVCEREGG